VVARYFGDRGHGGRARALVAALAFRDEALEKLPPLLFVMRRFVKSRTGVVGVRVQVDRKKQGIYRAYVASWPDAIGRRRTRTFSFAKFGKARAFELARRARRHGLAQLARLAPKTRPLNRRRR
jgi:hypothetical protein